ncbi:MAG: Nif3-like dinuclear metal center hexameric protein [Bacteroidaceae bacterium]|nr:Nif3-like dinuclear metal center hexameric protein [Bacteroidaceae bacterium]
MKVRDVIRALELFAPLPLQESYDNAGLQVGITEAEVSGALLCLDVTEEVVAEALELDCDLIVSHHPLLFHGLKRISDATQAERCVRLAIQHGIAIYSAHTNLDNAEDGVNYRFAEKLGLLDVELMMPRRVVATIDDHEQPLKAGSGVMGYLPEGEDPLLFLQRVKEVFGVECLMHNELLRRPIQSVALCGGAGAFLLDEAVRLGADAFLTGEMGYHHFFGYEQQIQIAVLGHYQSERFTPDLLYSLLGRKFPTLPIFRSTVNTNPIKYL